MPGCKPPEYPGPKRVIGFMLTKATIKAIKAESDALDCWPARLVEQILRDHIARRAAGKKTKPKRRSAAEASAV